VNQIEKWKPEGLRFECAWVGNGVLLYTCNATNCSVPVGSVWVLLGSNSYGVAVAEVLDVYVPEKFRRMGIGTWMLRWLVANYGTLKTGTGTKAGGMALLKATGWKQNRQTGDWYLHGTPRKVKK
jgi:GNAT superfamily N-acetyltransferase